jgi:hypothetical protein
MINTNPTHRTGQNKLIMHRVQVSRTKDNMLMLECDCGPRRTPKLPKAIQKKEKTPHMHNFLVWLIT